MSARRSAARVALTAVVVVASTVATGRAGAAGGAPETGTPPLVGGSALARGVFVTYSDKETVIEGGTVVPPDATVALAEASVDLTGRGNALGAPAYTPYAEAAGLINAFAGTELPFGEIGERSRAKVAGSPRQEAEVPIAGDRPAARARARIVEGPKAEADSAAVDGSAAGLTVAVGQSHAVVDTAGGRANAAVTVVLRHVVLGDDVVINTVRLDVRAVADGAEGFASASSVVEGVTFAGRPVRLTPRGFEPLGPGPDPGGVAPAPGIEVVATGSETAEAGGGQADARATGPRLRFSSPDGRAVEVVVGQASVSSTRIPGGGDSREAAGSPAMTIIAPDPRARSGARASSV